jgi:hypothetical protein
LDEEGTPLDTTSVKTLTRVFFSNMKHKPHPSLATWGERLAIRETHWRIVASRYNNTLLTPRDYHLHFKHITHRRREEVINVDIERPNNLPRLSQTNPTTPMNSSPALKRPEEASGMGTEGGGEGR